MSELKLQRMKVELIRGGVAPKFVVCYSTLADSEFSS